MNSARISAPPIIDPIIPNTSNSQRARSGFRVIGLNLLASRLVLNNDSGNRHWQKHLCENVIEAYEKAMKGI